MAKISDEYVEEQFYQRFHAMSEQDQRAILRALTVVHKCRSVVLTGEKKDEAKAVE